MHAETSCPTSDFSARSVSRSVRRAVTGSVIAGVIGTPLGALLGCASVTLLTGSYGGFTSEFGTGVGAVAGCGIGGLVGATIVLRSAAKRKCLALAIDALAGVAVVPVVHNFAAYYLGTPDTAAANAWLALRLLGLGVGSGWIEAIILTQTLNFVRGRWEWWHRWDPRSEEPGS